MVLSGYESTINKALVKNSDFLLGTLLLVIVSLLIIPLPSILLDFLICANISFALIILLVSIYIPKSLSLSSFPSILLVATLFRLGLNVATSRKILLSADAGDIILAFGNSVVGGNLIVGIVMFLLLMLINMLVVAKGSERVAEVAARFTLDAMPGKQMSIDADMRSGNIELDDAKKKRSELSRESQLFGAMDGAMKFVKGDVVASIVIFFINIIAGILMGVTELGMDVKESMMTFCILSVGDGLVSIIPGLLMSICAGLIVTRVESSSSLNIGGEIITQVKAYPKVFLLGAVFIVIAGLIPGMPIAPFLVMAFASLLYWYFNRKNDTTDSKKEAFHSENHQTSPNLLKDGQDSQTGVLPLAIEVGASLVPFVDDKSGFLRELVPQLRESIFCQLGVKIPAIQVKAVNTLGALEYTILLNEIPLGKYYLDPKELLVCALPHELISIGIAEAKKSINPNSKTPCSIVSGDKEELLVKHQVDYWGASGRMLLHLASVIKDNATEFLSLHETQIILDELESSYPSLVREVIPKIVSVNRLTDILQRLIKEGVSIKDSKTILQKLANFEGYEEDSIFFTEQVRQGLSRSICHKYAQSNKTLMCILISPTIEEVFIQGVEDNRQGGVFALDPMQTKKILQAFKEEVGKFPATSKKPVILTSEKIRRFVRDFLHRELPHVGVLSFQELHHDFQIQPVGRVHLLEEDENNVYDSYAEEEESLNLAPSPV